MVTLGSSELPVTTPPPSPHLLPPTPPMTPKTAVMEQAAVVAELKESSDESEAWGGDDQLVTGPLPTPAQTEELLTDVLYSVHSLMGGTVTGVWKVGGESDLGGPSTRGEVHMEQVVQLLQAAFQVSQETIDRLRADVRSRPPPEVNLQLSIKEAKDLRPKTVKGTTNPYVIVIVPSGNASHRTRLEKDTLWPKWNQDFTLPISNFQKEYLRLEVWHEHDPVKMRHALTAVRDIKGMSRLVRGTTAQVQQQTSHLLGQVVVNVKDLSERGADGWFMLEKNEERSKERGSIHLAGTVTSKAPLENKSRQSYDALLVRLVHHQLTATNNNNEDSEWLRPWDGHLSGPGAASLAQYAIMLDLSDAAIQLAWWKVCSPVPRADGEWIFSRLRSVQAAMSKNLYQEEEMLELRLSFARFVRDHKERLKDLHKAFPPSSGIIARRQLSFTLKTFQCMQNHAGTRALLDMEGLPHLHEMVTSCLATHAKNWWTEAIDELRDVRTTDEQISHVINILKKTHTFLSIAANTYNAIFMKEMNIPYMQTTYLMVSKKMNPCVRPLVMNIYNRLPARGNYDEEETEECEYSLGVGTSLWELYMNLGRLHQLGETLPDEARAESGVREYHRWFSRGVLRWLELALCRARSMIKRAVELDTLEPQDNYCKFSSSASDTLGVFNEVKIWWQKLAWPDPENSAVVLTKILEDICSCVISYSNLIQAKVEGIFKEQENITRVFITEQICVGLNNIERVRMEMVNLPTQFGFQELLLKIRAVGSGDSAAAQLEATVDRLIVNAVENMEGKVNEFINTVLEKMKPTLERAVNEACEAQSSRPLLAQVLDPSLELTLDRFNASNFNRFLWRVWEVVVEIFDATVVRNRERRKANYFGGVHSILEATLNFISPPDGKGLDEKTAMTPAYTSLMELLECLRMSTESLIAQYYQERYDEQMEEILPCKARLYVRVLFTNSGKLIVEVIMAKDMVVESDTSSITSRGGGLGATAHQPVDSYVKVQLVPQEWFPAAPIRKTKTQRKQDPAVYEETFEYELSKKDDGVRAGFLLLTLKDYNLGFTNTFIGEAVVPFSSLQCVDSSQVHTVPNTCFTMTSPGLDIGYKSLRALQFRTGDKVASSFIKKVSKRLIEPKAKTSTPLRPDEDKARSKSPNLRERLKFS
ncbi:protein unc-13 homolog 4B-like isoform X3 [Eriocheir sinensis]|uniref:protein unc-13 homolog 4B-like isoform X3 n=1 Tax=Eriocheir sinensis TaxID=95602 RepID=UPI0021C9F9FD|nr:protein unc-13 homolog 4B-like isoform X3 [Eriocheir sinensis]